MDGAPGVAQGGGWPPLNGGCACQGGGRGGAADGSGSVSRDGPPIDGIAGMAGGADCCGILIGGGPIPGGPGICGGPDGMAGACIGAPPAAAPIAAAPDGPLAKRVCGRLEFMAARR